ncbi:hypothetical protein BJX66DRAFT_341642 [Aspergillus keveii]|uniref:Uncharacterized protein n=1 Tax=Aspergillus keveii TaxID=714993 RepID=A0ABR4FUL5_9EURO
MRLRTALAALLLNAGTSRAAEDVTWDDSWEKNLRPDNITGLYYWFYPWIGSSYNGTMNFRMEVADWSDPEDYDYEDNVPCPKFADSTIELS